MVDLQFLTREFFGGNGRNELARLILATFRLIGPASSMTDDWTDKLALAYSGAAVPQTAIAGPFGWKRGVRGKDRGERRFHRTPMDSWHAW